MRTRKDGRVVELKNHELLEEGRKKRQYDLHEKMVDIKMKHLIFSYGVHIILV